MNQKEGLIFVQKLLNKHVQAILTAYYCANTPLQETCAVLIQSDHSSAVLLCRTGKIAEALARASGGETWPDFVEYAEERLRTMPANGMLRVVIACEEGFAQGRVNVLPGGAA